MVSLVSVLWIAAPVMTVAVTDVTTNGIALLPVSSGNRTKSPTSHSVVKSPDARVKVLAVAFTVIDKPAVLVPSCQELVIAPASNSSWLDALSSMEYSPATCLLPVRMDDTSRLPSSSFDTSASRVTAGMPPVLRSGDQLGLVGVTPGVSSAT